ncbi:hypothetical protein ACFXKR_34965 [Streptomyces violascens]|uniref:hypothetical protein n=1 Tax=Streptomyces violascens TaxID=67381 RepID=UPI003687B52A
MHLDEADRQGQDLVLDVLVVNQRALALYRPAGPSAAQRADNGVLLATTGVHLA